MHPLASIPSPTQSAWHLGPFPIRAYALCIIVGIIVCLWLTLRRWRARGGSDNDVWDVAGWAIVFGIIGGRLYHLMTDPELYFYGRPGTNPWNAFKIWDGGLGIWGAIALGAFGAWIGCRRKGIKMAPFADAVVPGVVIAQGIGRLGNWFNNELFGGPTSLPWKLEIHDIDTVTGQARPCTFGDVGAQVCGYYQPTFLYELLWDIALGFALIYIDRRLRLGRGNVCALYIMGYTVGRVWIEALREDHANHILGVRLNIWTCLVVFLIGLIWFLRHDGFRARREQRVYRSSRAGGSADDTDEGNPDEGSPDGSSADDSADGLGGGDDVQASHARPGD